jgi:hypothetical protein
MFILNSLLKNSKVYKYITKINNMNKSQVNEYKLRCEYYIEIGVFGGGCYAPEGCIYGNHQITLSKEKGCNVSGIVSSSDLSQDMRDKLNDTTKNGLVNRVEVTRIELPKKS